MPDAGYKATLRRAKGARVSEQARMFCTGADFCQELAGAAITDFSRIYFGDPKSRIISRTSNLALLADISPLTMGHLLLVSNDHYLSFGEVVGDHAREVDFAIRQIFDKYSETFGNPVVLEHGSSKSMDGTACITHAHLHFVPLDLEKVNKVMRRDGLSAAEIDSLSELRLLGQQGLPYFYCGDRVTHWVYGVAHQMRRQYLRSVAGELLGIEDPEWDYALVVRKEMLRTTMTRTQGWTFVSA